MFVLVCACVYVCVRVGDCVFIFCLSVVVCVLVCYARACLCVAACSACLFVRVCYPCAFFLVCFYLRVRLGMFECVPVYERLCVLVHVFVRF